MADESSLVKSIGNRKNKRQYPMLPVNSEWTGYPSKHPHVPDPTGTEKISNVRLSTYEHEGRHYVVPSMVEGKDLSKGFSAMDYAMDKGLENYPWFHTAKAALMWSQEEHANIRPDGTWDRVKTKGKKESTKLDALRKFIGGYYNYTKPPGNNVSHISDTYPKDASLEKYMKNPGPNYRNMGDR